MEKTTAKKIMKVAIFLYLASFLIINWADVSWIFNYRQVSGLVSDFFNPYPSINASAINVYFYPNHSGEEKVLGTETLAEKIKIDYTDKQNILDIPKINISVPIIFSEKTDIPSLEKDLDSGAVYYPGSVYPGNKGQIVILGHSAPPGWPKIKHDWIFTDLDELEAGDKIMININNKQYTYIVKKRRIIEKGADVPRNDIREETNTLILISCWPPGKDYQRIVIIAEIQLAQK